MIRKIIKIDQDKCNGCGLCAQACHEDAIGMVNGKAVLLRDDYCDGLGDCLPACPTGAISFEEREAAAYDEAAVKANMAAKKAGQSPTGGCPGSNAHRITHDSPAPVQASDLPSQLNQWPVQIKLVPVNAPYFSGADLLIAADCTAFSFGNFHNAFMRGKITLIGCPKLDEGDYSEKLSAIFAQNDIRTITVTRMDVPCCGGIVAAVKTALATCEKPIPLQVVTISTDGKLLGAELF